MKISHNFDPQTGRELSNREKLLLLANTELSQREIEVLCLIASGASNKMIASSLGISCKTSDAHRQRIYDKLQIHGAVELTHFALAAGLVSNRYE